MRGFILFGQSVGITGYLEGLTYLLGRQNIIRKAFFDASVRFCYIKSM